MQIDALEEAGCERVFQDQVSGIVNTRPNLNQALNFARSGDTLVVSRLDRFSRSLRDLIETVTLLESRGVQLKSLYETIDTASSSGKLTFHLFGASIKCNAHTYAQPSPSAQALLVRVLLMSLLEYVLRQDLESRRSHDYSHVRGPWPSARR